MTMPFSLPFAHVIVVAPPSETRGPLLADALRRQGMAVTVATTPEEAATAAGAIVVAVLTPATKADRSSRQLLPPSLPK